MTFVGEISRACKRAFASFVWSWMLLSLPEYFVKQLPELYVKSKSAPFQVSLNVPPTSELYKYEVRVLNLIRTVHIKSETLVSCRDQRRHDRGIKRARGTKSMNEQEC